ncbi:hypothetical protein GGR56DRAFT_671559 [Xylariaceae sp. FL0804]|nr:hypothetical protein GGR56DRAFT_671559 [Xylariaceae sp. FL0804]
MASEFIVIFTVITITIVASRVVRAALLLLLVEGHIHCRRAVTEWIVVDDVRLSLTGSDDDDDDNNDDGVSSLPICDLYPEILGRILPLSVLRDSAQPRQTD